MASDWIKYQKNLPSKLETLQIANLTGRSRREVVAILMEFWAWADDHTEDGLLPGMNVRILSAICPDTDGHFWETVAAVGWLTIQSDPAKPQSDYVEITNFPEHMGSSAKRRANEAKRKRLSRYIARQSGQASASAADNAGHAEDTSAANSVTREEKRREDILTSSLRSEVCPETSETSSGPNAPPPPQPEAVLTFPTAGKTKTWDLGAALVAELAAAFPALDVLGECKKAHAWLVANPGRRKTARGMARFLFNWLARSQDKGPPQPARAAGPAARPETTREKVERIQAERASRTPSAAG